MATFEFVIRDDEEAGKTMLLTLTNVEDETSDEVEVSEYYLKDPSMFPSLLNIANLQCTSCTNEITPAFDGYDCMRDGDDDGYSSVWNIGFSDGSVLIIDVSTWLPTTFVWR